MLRIAAFVLFALAILPGQALAQFCAVPSAASDAEIRHILAERIDSERRGVGIVVGIITPQGRRVISHGAFGRGDPRRLDGDTLFEIASVGKVFTALALADMVQRGQVALDDPVARYPPDVKMLSAATAPSRCATSTHTSGLRACRRISPPAIRQSICRLYGRAALCTLSGYELARDIGSQYAYSNLGYGLLGIVSCAAPAWITRRWSRRASARRSTAQHSHHASGKAEGAGLD